MKKALDFASTAARARTMSSSELHYARVDCREAAAAADELERAGIAVEKDGGYYIDEAGVYAAEQKRRAEAA